MEMARVTPTQIDCLNLNLMIDAYPIGSQIETDQGIGTISGIKTYKEQLVFTVSIEKDGKKRTYPVDPAKFNVDVITDPNNMEAVSKVAADVVGIISEMLPKSVESKVEALPEFEYSGPRLRAMRIAAGLTQVFVAEYLGMAKSSSAAIGDWEAERNKVPVKHQAKLIELYTPKPEEVLEEVQELQEEVVEDTVADVEQAETAADNEATDAEADEASDTTSEEESTE